VEGLWQAADSVIAVADQDLAVGAYALRDASVTEVVPVV
jgi:hypothetical protein